MKAILRQDFTLGRFHATPWKVFPYDDPYGEWPPSPWRLIRAIIARSYQLERELLPPEAPDRAALVSAFCNSEISWKLPEFTWRGPGLRQYQPVEFKWNPASAKRSGEKAYGTSKVQDNFWLTPKPDPEEQTSIWWFLSGDFWSIETVDLLDACLKRMTYFGRAESITEISVVREADDAPAPNCHLHKIRRSGMVPVLAPDAGATIEQVQATSDDPAVANSTIPPGSRWLYAERPAKPLFKRASQRLPGRKPTQLIQFAIGSRVSPQVRDTVRLTNRFRGRVLKIFLQQLTNKTFDDWRAAGPEFRARAALMTGKSAEGIPLRSHEHAVYFLHIEDGKPVRLCVWRSQPFDNIEQAAILAAAETPLPLGFKGDPWTLTLIPLDSLVSPPPSTLLEPSFAWKTLTPFVPPRHVFDRQGRVKRGDSVGEQVIRELSNRGVDPSGVKIVSEPAGWVIVHNVRSGAQAGPNQHKLGYHLLLQFPEPVRGPLFLGHSSHFGLGVLTPRTYGSSDRNG